jgi:hypothetical protein
LEPDHYYFQMRREQLEWLGQLEQLELPAQAARAIWEGLAEEPAALR